MSQYLFCRSGNWLSDFVDPSLANTKQATMGPWHNLASVPSVTLLPSIHPSRTVRSMNTTADVAIASFYPNLMSIVKVKVNGADTPINCSHDLGAFNDETRHFIDEHYLREVVPGGR